MVSAEGLSGRFELKGSTASLRVKTMSGDIFVPRAVGFVELVTVTGDIDVTSRGVRRGTLRSTAGRTRFAGAVPRDGSLRFETSSGEIDLRLPRNVAADFELTSLGGGRSSASWGRSRGAPGTARRWRCSASPAARAARRSPPAP